MIAEAEKMDSEEPLDDPVAPEVLVEQVPEAEPEPQEAEPDSRDEGETQPPEPEVDAVDTAVAPDVAVDSVDDPESPDIPVEEAGDSASPDVAVDDPEAAVAPDLADDQQDTRSEAVDIAEPDAGPVDDNVALNVTVPDAETLSEPDVPAIDVGPLSDTANPSVTEPAAIDEPDVPASEVDAEQPMAEPALAEPDVPDEVPADAGDSSSESDPVGLVEIHDLPPVTESQYRQSQSAEPEGFGDAVSQQMQEQSRIGNEIASSIAKELSPQFDLLRDNLQMSTQDFMTTQSILLQYMGD